MASTADPECGNEWSVGVSEQELVTTRKFTGIAS
jgi:hypothetical protein